MCAATTGLTMASLSTYAILGCGSVGHAVADELVSEGKEVLIVDKDDDRVETLRDQDMDAQQARIETDAVADAVTDRDVVLILAAGEGPTMQAVEKLRDRSADQYIVARGSDPVSADRIREAGADVVINPSSVIADSALRALESGELEYKAQQLIAVVVDTDRRLGIRLHHSPDPDAIASATALQAIADSHDVEADIHYDGEIGHQENRAFVNLLGIDLTPTEAPDQPADGTTAVLDSTPMTGDADIDPEIVIDHHAHDTDTEAQFTDIRPDVSATSTILTKYVQELDLPLDEQVATALLHGIRAATLDFKRDATPADLTAAAYLYPFANHDTLEQVESPSMSPETLDVLAGAIQNRKVRGSHLLSNAGFITDRNALTQAAQHLLNLEGITTTAVFAIVDGTIHVSARSNDIRLDIGDVLETAFAETGNAVGHSTDASAEIPLGIFTGVEIDENNRETLLTLAEQAVKQKLFDALGVESNGNGA